MTTIKLNIRSGYRMDSQENWDDEFIVDKIINGGVCVDVRMQCKLLTHVPEIGEEVFLGLSEKFLYPWNVVVKRIE